MIHVPPKLPDEPPFIVEISYEPEKNGSFHPTSRIVIGAGMRTLGAKQSAEIVGILTILASHVTANGTISPTARTLQRAVGMRVFGRLRLARLARMKYRGQPLVVILKTAAGTEMFRLGSTLLMRRELPPAQSAAPVGAAPAGRDVVLMHSRTTYSRDRESVEREIMARNGFVSPEEIEEAGKNRPKPPTDLESTWAVQRLMKEQVDYSLAVKLVNDYGAERVLRQVKAIDRRRIKTKRNRYLVAAIMHDYPVPTGNANE